MKRLLASALILAALAAALPSLAQEVGVPLPVARPPKEPGPPLIFDTEVHGGLAFATPVGDGYREFDADLGFDLGVRFVAGPTSYIHLYYCHQMLGTEPYLDYVGDDLVPTSFSTSASVDEFCFLYGGQIGQNRRTGTTSFAEIGLDMMRHKASTDFYGRDYTDTETRLGAVLRLGAIIPVGEKYGLEVAASFRHKPSIVLYTDELGGTLVGFHVGFAYLAAKDQASAR